MKYSKKKFIVALILILIIVLVFIYFKIPTISSLNEAVKISPTAISSNTDPIATSTPDLTYPISDAAKRITKKPFGIYVSPNKSPVKPERFSGYHTGVDFEIISGEENLDVTISAICDGSIIYKNYVSGYGGVMIQKCTINKEVVTVLYGHLKFSSIPHKINDKIKVGDKIAILGKGYSTETDGERKHLHLGIHKGNKIDLRGYVKNIKELSGWIDFTKTKLK